MTLWSNWMNKLAVLRAAIRTRNPRGVRDSTFLDFLLCQAKIVNLLSGKILTEHCMVLEYFTSLICNVPFMLLPPTPTSSSCLCIWSWRKKKDTSFCPFSLQIRVVPVAESQMGNAASRGYYKQESKAISARRSINCHYRIRCQTWPRFCIPYFYR